MNSSDDYVEGFKDGVEFAIKVMRSTFQGLVHETQYPYAAYGVSRAIEDLKGWVRVSEPDNPQL